MSGLYDLHTHTLVSDGDMLPIELIRRMSVIGYTTVAVTDHVDATNTRSVVENLQVLRTSAEHFGVHLLCGVEITHVPPVEIPVLA
jgi:histidinol phosphatase-like PHP family hydrolase